MAKWFSDFARLRRMLYGSTCGGYGLACPPLADKHMVYQGRLTATWIWLAPVVLCLYG